MSDDDDPSPNAPGPPEFAEEDCLPLSGLQHFMFCPRQCALIHVEQQWQENTLTALGRELHERVDAGGVETRPGLEVLRDVAVTSARLGVHGKADLVEVRQAQRDDGATVTTFYPVEYKRGPLGEWLADEVQLCAQAMALEETLGCDIPTGAIYHGASHHRREVRLSEALRRRTRQAAADYHRLVRLGLTPTAARQPKCESCSLLDVCLPEETASASRASRYVRRLFEEYALGVEDDAAPSPSGDSHEAARAGPASPAGGVPAEPHDPPDRGSKP